MAVRRPVDPHRMARRAGSVRLATQSTTDPGKPTDMSTPISRSRLSRRHALQAGAALGFAAAAGATQAAATQGHGGRSIPLAFNDPIWNRETRARLEGDTAPGRFVHGYATGIVHAVRSGEAVKPLFGFEVFSGIRVLRQPDGSYQRLCRELIFYKDLKSGELMDQWDNVLTGERVKVVDVANDPFNYIISEYFPDPPSYGGLNKDKPPKRPLLLKWDLLGDIVSHDSDIHLYYPNALNPAKWPRESSGPMNQVSELFRYFMRREDVENPELTHLPHSGVWARITPWLPWMLMDGAPGYIYYMGKFSSIKTPDMAPANVLKRVQERWPLYLTAPDKWVEPSLSSLENYARTQQPQPPKQKT